MGTPVTEGRPAYSEAEVPVKLKTIRLDAGLTQVELAERSGCSASTIINIEKRATCRTATRRVIAAALRGAGVRITS